MGLKKIKQFIEEVKALDELPDDNLLEKIADAFIKVLESYTKKKPKNHKDFKKIMELQLELEELAGNILEKWGEQLSIENKVELTIIAQGGDTWYRAIGRCIGSSLFIVKKVVKNSRFEILFNPFTRVQLRFRKSYLEKKRISRRVLTSSAQAAYSSLIKKSKGALTFSDMVIGAGIPKSGLCPTGVRHGTYVRSKTHRKKKSAKKDKKVITSIIKEQLPAEDIASLPIKAKGGMVCPLCNLMAVPILEDTDSEGRKVRIYRCMKGHKSKELLK